MLGFQPRRVRYVENDFDGDVFPIDVLNELSSESIHICDNSIRMGGEIIGYMDVNPKKETPDR